MVQASLTTAAPSTGRLSVAQAARVASTDCPVLISGETGVGKGYLARWIHDQSTRAGAPFVTVNCGAIPADIIDSHLFGHRRGAFSDAHADHGGLVHQADGGTILLDEIADLPTAGQLRMLRLIEDGEIQPVGSPRPVRVDVRVLAATRFDLSSLVAEGSFRMDLYYRLDVIELHVQPLRDRLDQLPRLLASMSEEIAEQIGRCPLELSDDAMALLLGHDWPGNVRELRTVLERLYVMVDGPAVTAADLREVTHLAPRPRRAFDADDHRHLAVEQALEACEGNISHAAEALGVHRSTVHRWLQRASA